MATPPDRIPTKQDLSIWRETVNRLKKELVPSCPVYIRRVNLKNGNWGQCSLVKSKTKDNYFLIKIHNKVTLASIYYILVHEYAHALAWVEGKKVQDHGPEWGIWYGKCYQVVFDVE